MDHELERLIHQLGELGEKIGVTMTFKDADNVEIIARDSRQNYKLKPLRELYADDKGVAAVMGDDRFLPLLMCIEEEILRYGELTPDLTDATIYLALQRLSLNPEEATNDELICVIQTALRATLSLNDYSRQNVRQATRIILKSMDRHKSGDCGYLDFITEQLNRR